MAGRRPVGESAPPAARGPVEVYLVRLAAGLHGPTRARAAVVDEVRGSLDDAIDGFTSRGMSRPDAVTAALAELGAPESVAAAFAGELATLQARRTLWIYILTGPLVGIWWLLLLVPRPWEPTLGVVFAAIPVLPLIAAAVATAIVAIATTGSLIRWLPETAPRRAIIASVVVAIASMIGDVTVLTILVVRALGDALGEPPALLWIVAVCGSVCRLAYSAWTLRRCGRVLRSLGAANPSR